MGELKQRKRKHAAEKAKKLRDAPPPTSKSRRLWRSLRPGPEDLLLVAFLAMSARYFSSLTRVPIHRPEDFAGMRAAGSLAARTLAHVEPRVISGTTTAEIDRVAAAFVAENGAVAATVGYRGYKHSTCVSMNDVVCHGIPSEDVTLRDGDIVNVDVTVIVDGWHGDTSRTFIVGGEEKASEAAAQLVNVTRESLEIGVSRCGPGRRMGDVVVPIRRHLERHGYAVVNKYAAHGIGRKFHAPPHIRHGAGAEGRGVLLKPGMFFTIEPMANEKGVATRVLKDGWTVVTADGGLSAQFEHTVGVRSEEDGGGCEVFTRLDASAD
jgi:methionyl aminopeptidase